MTEISSIKSRNKHPLIALDSEEGQKLLSDIQNNHGLYIKPLHQIFCKQRGRSNCGIQSAALVMNSSFIGANQLQPDLPYSEASLYGYSETTAITGEESKVEGRGITLEQLHQLLEAHNYKNEIHYADQSDINKFRAACQKSLQTPSYQSSIIINYDMSILGQGDTYGGHHTPIGGYHPESDRLLVLDVWPHTESVWACLSDVFVAMDTVDSQSQRSRGYCITLCDKYLQND